MRFLLPLLLLTASASAQPAVLEFGKPAPPPVKPEPYRLASVTLAIDAAGKGRVTVEAGPTPAAYVPSRLPGRPATTPTEPAPLTGYGAAAIERQGTRVEAKWDFASITSVAEVGNPTHAKVVRGCFEAAAPPDRNACFRPDRTFRVPILATVEPEFDGELVVAAICGNYGVDVFVRAKEKDEPPTVEVRLIDGAYTAPLTRPTATKQTGTTVIDFTLPMENRTWGNVMVGCAKDRRESSTPMRLRRVTVSAAAPGPFWGVQFVPADDEPATVREVPTGALKAAGLRTGDVVMAVDGQMVRNHHAATYALGNAEFGREVVLTVARERRAAVVKVRAQ